jgi:hypothetical protein
MLPIVAFSDLVRPQTRRHVEGVGHGGDVVRRRGLQLVHKIHDSRQFVDDVVKFLVRELQSGERCDVLNLFFG